MYGKRVDENDEGQREVASAAKKKKQYTQSATRKQIGTWKMSFNFKFTIYFLDFHLNSQKKAVGFMLLWCQSFVACALCWSGHRSIPCRFINCSFMRWQPNIFLFHQRYEPLAKKHTHKKMHTHEWKYRACFLFRTVINPINSMGFCCDELVNGICYLNVLTRWVCIGLYFIYTTEKK